MSNPHKFGIKMIRNFSRFRKTKYCHNFFQLQKKFCDAWPDSVYFGALPVDQLRRARHEETKYPSYKNSRWIIWRNIFRARQYIHYTVYICNVFDVVWVVLTEHCHRTLRLNHLNHLNINLSNSIYIFVLLLYWNCVHGAISHVLPETTKLLVLSLLKM